MNFLLLSAFLPCLCAYAAVFTVGVGKDETTGLKGVGFDPSVIYPNAGDSIIFEFRSGNHSVVQSSYDKPCTPNGGFDSGVFTVAQDVEVDADSLPSATHTVKDSKPMWFYDAASGECNDGAVFAANAPTSGDETAAGFKEKASSATVAATSTSATESATSTSDSAGPASTSAPSQQDENGAASVASWPYSYMLCLCLAVVLL
ncbi:hypothetical protein BD626DRAFT_539020 [Schizophyllum amplum]|uniref:Cupredoxin n=1 Tax=Schizophyllum amplum TaxID=97359 RepID=A0A550C5I2_9AGAR|nr:hypothetical protein BD626DRAFT_539020 [Auriculariopsis ampla]